MTHLKNKFFDAYSTQETRLAGDVFEKHFHFEIEFLMLLTGNISVQIENKSYLVSPYSLIVIPPPNYHATTANEPTEYQRIVVMTSTTAIPKPIEELFYSQVKKHPLFKSKTITRIINNIRDLMSAEENTRFSALLDSLMVQLIYAVAFFEDNNDKSIIVLPDDKNLSAVIKYINSHITENISLADISANCFIAKSTLSHLFKEKMNISVKQYILQKKMIYASSLIAEGILPNTVAKSLGYENYSNFFSIYKKIMGEPPSKTKNNKE